MSSEELHKNGLVQPKKYSSSIKLNKIRLASVSNQYQREILQERNPLFSGSHKIKQKNLLSVKLSPLQMGKIKIDQTKTEGPVIKILKSTFNDAMKKRSSSSKVILPKFNRQEHANTNAADEQIKKSLQHLIHKDFRQHIAIAQKQQVFIPIISPKWWKVISSLLASVKELASLVLKQEPEKSKHYTEALSNFAFAYTCFQKEETEIQTQALTVFQDKNHIALILQIFLYEKRIIYYILAMKKWGLQYSFIMVWISEAAGSILYLRRILLEIYTEVIENNQKFNKLRKPNHISREKKLIRINKQLSLLDETTKQMHQSLPKQYDIFKNQCLTLMELLHLENQFRSTILGSVLPPFCRNINRKEYCFIFDPQDIFFKEDKKNSCIVLRSFTELLFSRIGIYANLVIFSSKQTHFLTDFLRSIDPIKVDEILDKRCITYKEGKPIKDILKIDHDITKMIILDKHQRRYFHEWMDHCIPSDKLLAQNENSLNLIWDKLIQHMMEHKSIETGLISDLPLFEKRKVTRH